MYEDTKIGAFLLLKVSSEEHYEPIDLFFNRQTSLSSFFGVFFLFLF